MDGAGDLPHVLPALVGTERFSLAADGAENSLPTMSQAEDVSPAITPTGGEPQAVLASSYKGLLKTTKGGRTFTEVR